jgi:hypothetical protein
MFWLLQAHGAAEDAGHAETATTAAAHGGESAGHHTPPLVEAVNHFIGEPLHEFQMHYTKPLWDKAFASFGTDAETVFGVYTAENAVPWYTVMFIIACLITLALIWILKASIFPKMSRTAGSRRSKWLCWPCATWWKISSGHMA